MKKLKVDKHKKLASSIRSRVSDQVTATQQILSTDTWLFVTVFAMGFLIILFFNTVAQRPDDIDGWEITVRIFPLVLIMVIYALAVTVTGRFRLQSGQAGDNCYYLGFLFTLVSLAFALYEYVDRIDDTSVVRDFGIVQDFGIALATTIVGLVLRVLLSQARIDPDDVGRIARTELVTAAQQMREQLDSVVVDFNSFRRSIEQSIVDMLREQKEANIQIRDDTIGKHIQVVENWAQTIAGASSAYVDSIGTLKTSTEVVESAIQKFAASMERDTNRMEEQRNSIEQVNESISKLREQYSSLIVMSEVFGDQFIEKFKKFSDTMETVSNLLEKDSETLTEVGLAFKNSVSELSELKPTFLQLTDELRVTVVDEHSKVIEEWSKNAEKTSEEITERSIKLSSATEAAALAVNSLAERVKSDTSGFEKQREVIDEVTSSIVQLNENLNKVGTILDNDKIRNFEVFVTEISQLVSLLENNKQNLGEAESSVKSILDDLKKLEPLLQRFPSNIEEIDKLIQDVKPKRNLIKRVLGRGN